MQIGYSSLSNLAVLRSNIRRERISSYDRSGGNNDFLVIAPGVETQLAEIRQAGCIKHIWMTMSSPDPLYSRKIILRMWWDGENDKFPSVEVPIGDFFGIGHGIVKDFWSLPLCMSPSDGRGFNCFFPMPFSSRASISIENETSSDLNFYYYIDYESYSELEDAYGRFHAQWRRDPSTAGWGPDTPNIFDNQQARDEIWSRQTLDDNSNYLILDARGKGQYVGCHIDIDCFNRQKNDWYGEGDDMFVIDGEPWPPRLHGTGTEDYFNTAYCPTREFYTPYHGITVYSGTPEWPWGGKNSLYRFHIEDPIYFESSLRFSIEHGHANNLANDYSSTAYWYQTEPHFPFPQLLNVEKRMPSTLERKP